MSLAGFTSTRGDSSGAVSQATGVKVETVRCYERIGLMLASVRDRIAALNGPERDLAAMADECARGDLPACPIINTLFAG